MTTNLLSVIEQQHKALEELLSAPNDDSPESVVRCILSHTKARKAIAAGKQALEQAQVEATHGKVRAIIGVGPQYRPDEHERGEWRDSEDGVCLEFADGYRDCFYVSELATHPQATEPAPKRPINCGTGHCSCIECVMEPAPSLPDFDDAEVPDSAPWAQSHPKLSADKY